MACTNWIISPWNTLQMSLKVNNVTSSRLPNYLTAFHFFRLLYVIVCLLREGLITKADSVWSAKLLGNTLSNLWTTNFRKHCKRNEYTWYKNQTPIGNISFLFTMFFFLLLYRYWVIYPYRSYLKINCNAQILYYCVKYGIVASLSLFSKLYWIIVILKYIQTTWIKYLKIL